MQRCLQSMVYRGHSQLGKADFVSSPAESTLHRGLHGLGQRGRVISQGGIACRHTGVEARLQLSELAKLAHDLMADLLDHGGDVGVGRWLAFDKAQCEALITPRVGTQRITCSTRWATVCAMRRPAHDGQNPRRLQLKASSSFV